MNMIRKSPWVSIFNASSCNGCDIEVLTLVTPKYDIERFGAQWKMSPRHADILIVTGCTNETTKKRLKTVYDQMAHDKVVMAIGTCGNSGNFWRFCYNVKQRTDSVVPIDIYVPGCPPRPETIIDAVVKALALLKEKKNETKKNNKKATKK
ncbi:MAG: NADH-quinone oxidoreductase subunit NuoB [Nanoarchaeota archaeon]|nr:NADH-quinone oxidoreductase subunit NuoB [Nanoarchaeota archaeon]